MLDPKHIEEFNSTPKILIPNRDKILKAIKYSSEQKKLVMIFGKPGFGKTRTFYEAVMKNSKYHYSHIGYRQPAKSVFAQFLHEVSTNEPISPDWLLSRTNIYYMIQKSASIIEERRDLKLIIFDEMGNLGPAMLPHIRNLWDQIKGRTGMILAGPPSFKRDLNNWAKNDKRGVNELLSRTSRMVTLHKNHDFSTVEEICNSRNILDNQDINFLFQTSHDLRKLHDSISDIQNGSLKAQ